MKILSTFLLIMSFPIFLLAQGANDNWTFHQQPGDGWFSGLDEDSNGNIIVGGGLPNSHFRIFDDSTWTLYHPYDYLLNYSFLGRGLTVDADDNIWLSPGNHDGVTKWDGTSFENFITSNSGIISNSNFGVAVDQNNNLWTSSLQSFENNSWLTFSNNGCYKGGARLVFIDDDNKKWVSGIVSVGFDTGIVEQPCVYQINDNNLNAYHFEEGDNLPELEAFSGYHLMGQLSDGTIILIGRTNNGIEIKNFNGTSWDDYHTFNSPEVGQSYWGLWIDENDNILLGGAKDNETAQIAKYCNGVWTFYDLPEADGFPSVIYNLMVDSQSRLWFAGNIGLGSVPYVSTICQTTSTQSVNQTKICSRINYQQGQLTLWDCGDYDTNSLDFHIYNSVGMFIKTGKLARSTHFVGQLAAGVYFIHLQNKDQENQILRFIAK